MKKKFEDTAQTEVDIPLGFKMVELGYTGHYPLVYWLIDHVILKSDKNIYDRL